VTAMTTLPTTQNDLSYGYLVDMVERYFNYVDNFDLDGVLSCFTEDAVVTIQSAHSIHDGRDSAIRTMYEELFANYRKHLRHIHFRHVADPENSRVASQFSVEMTDNDDNQIRLANSNFFYLESGKFKRMYIYMSDGVNVLG